MHGELQGGSMDEYLLFEAALCDCHGTCRCGWDEEEED